MDSRLGEHISFQYEKIILPAGLLLGVFSVIYWQYTGDLRFYGLVQFGTLAAIPLILLLYRSKYTQPHYLIYSMVCYGLAKMMELNDSRIFELTNGLISGHTAKHLLAAAASYYIYLMLNKRQAY
ncbi:MAG: hypothetical protein HOE45_04695 [Gammaproteobacteria bacterium]|nr:hypothetical protein [Gammaproteobacteria bacterium]